MKNVNEARMKSKTKYNRKYEKNKDLAETKDEEAVKTKAIMGKKKPEKQQSITRAKDLHSTTPQDQSQVTKGKHLIMKGKKKSDEKVASTKAKESSDDNISDDSENESKKRSKPPTEVLMARELFTAASETLKMAKHIRKLETKIHKLERKIEKDDESSSGEEHGKDNGNGTNDNSSSDSSVEEVTYKKKKKRRKKEKRKQSSIAKKKKTDNEPDTSKIEAATTNNECSMTLSPLKSVESYTQLSTPSPVVFTPNQPQTSLTSKLQSALQYLCQYCGYSVPEERRHELGQHIIDCATKYQPSEAANATLQTVNLDAGMTLTPLNTKGFCLYDPRSVSGGPHILSVQPGVALTHVHSKDISHGMLNNNGSSSTITTVPVTSTPQHAIQESPVELPSISSVTPVTYMDIDDSPQQYNTTPSTPHVNTATVMKVKKTKTYLQPPQQSQPDKHQPTTVININSQQKQGIKVKSEMLGNKVTVNSYHISSGLEYTCPDCGLVLAKAAKLNHVKVCRKIPTCLYCSNHFESVDSLLEHKPECKKKNWENHPVRKLQHDINVPDSEIIKTSNIGGGSTTDQGEVDGKMVLRVAKWVDDERNKTGEKSTKGNPIVIDGTSADDISEPVEHEILKTKVPKKVFFVCLKCDQQFARAQELRAHQQTPEKCEEWIKLKNRRTGVKASTRFCYSCMKMFANQNDFAKHRRTCVDSKPESKSYSCFSCYKTFDSQADLSTHKQLNHRVSESESNCWVCGATFPTFKEFLKHAETHKDVRSTIRKRSRPGYVRDKHHLVLKKETAPAALEDVTDSVPADVMNMLSQFQESLQNQQQQLEDTAFAKSKRGPSFVAQISRNEEDCVRYNIAVDTRGAVQVDSEPKASTSGLKLSTKNLTDTRYDVNQHSEFNTKYKAVMPSSDAKVKNPVRKQQYQLDKTDDPNIKGKGIQMKAGGQIAALREQVESVAVNHADKYTVKADGNVKAVHTKKSTEQQHMAKNIDSLLGSLKTSSDSASQLGKMLKEHGINRPVQITTNDPSVQKLLSSLQQKDQVMLEGNKVGYVLKGNIKGLPKNLQVKSSKFGDIHISKAALSKTPDNKKIEDVKCQKAPSSKVLKEGTSTGTTSAVMQVKQVDEQIKIGGISKPKHKENESNSEPKEIMESECETTLKDIRDRDEDKYSGNCELTIKTTRRSLKKDHEDLINKSNTLETNKQENLTFKESESKKSKKKSKKHSKKGIPSKSSKSKKQDPSFDEIPKRTTRSRKVSNIGQEVTDSQDDDDKSDHSHQTLTKDKVKQKSVSPPVPIALYCIDENKVKCTICAIELTSIKDVATHRCLSEPLKLSSEEDVSSSYRIENTTTEVSNRAQTHYAKLGKLGKVQMISSEEAASDEDMQEVDIEGEDDI